MFCLLASQSLEQEAVQKQKAEKQFTVRLLQQEAVMAVAVRLTLA
jgi:hypothetical protein